MNFCIHFSQSYKDVRNYQIDARQAGLNSDNVVTQQETNEALNELTNSVSYDHETI